jgi:hypothetical protein
VAVTVDRAGGFHVYQVAAAKMGVSRGYVSGGKLSESPSLMLVGEINLARKNIWGI